MFEETEQHERLHWEPFRASHRRRFRSVIESMERRASATSIFWVKKKTQTNRRKIQYVREVDRVTFGRDAADGAVAAAVFEFAGRTGAGQRVGHARRRDGVHEGRLACSCNDRDGINFLSLSISFLLFRLPPPTTHPFPLNHQFFNW